MAITCLVRVIKNANDNSILGIDMAYHDRKLPVEPQIRIRNGRMRIG